MIDRGTDKRAGDGFGRGVERAGERVADGLARGRKRGANCAEQRGLVGGRKRRALVRREDDNFGVDARRRTEIAGSDAEMLVRLPIERGENAQRRVRALARTRADALGDLALEHQNHPPDRAAHLVEPAQDCRSRVERQIADHFDRRPLDQFRKFDLEEVAVYHAHGGMSGKRALKPLRKPRVEFDQP